MLANDQLGGLAMLRRWVARPAPQERCELCAAALAEEHPHLFETEHNRVICACGACSLLFPQSARYRIVPREVRRLSVFQIDDALWRSLAVPIELAFFFQSSRTQIWSAVYPSPAGPMQAPIDAEAWNEFAAQDAALQALSCDVEALLVNRLDGAREYLVAPIDECYKLTGLVRRHWRGFSGGNEAWQQIRKFFELMERRAAGGRYA
jgi:hypothetical protein